MYYLFRQDMLPQPPNLEEGAAIKKRVPHPFVKDMKSMQIGKRRFWYFFVMSFLCRGFSRVFKEYDLILNGRIVSKAVLVSKVPIYRFLPSKGIHLCYCETVPDERGKGYYPLLLSYIQHDFHSGDLFMVVDENNAASLRGVEKAGFVKYGIGQKKNNGVFVEV